MQNNVQDKRLKPLAAGRSGYEYWFFITDIEIDMREDMLQPTVELVYKYLNNEGIRRI